MEYTSLNNQPTDTHGATGNGWYGFDLDGTLAIYNGWKGIDHIGAPIKPMVDLIKRMHDEGKVVKIMTARVAPKDEPETRQNPYFTVPNHALRHERELKFLELNYIYYTRLWTAKMFIIDWCLKNLGFIPEITHQKDGLMIELYDDRVKQVIPNKGVLIEDIASSFGKVLEQNIEEADFVLDILPDEMISAIDAVSNIFETADAAINEQALNGFQVPKEESNGSN